MTPKLIEPALKDERAREVLIRTEEFLIGRGTDCDLRVNDIEISRHHCLIRTRSGEITLADLGSSNGTYVNGTRVVSQVTLNPGDEIRLGQIRFIFEIGEGNRVESDATFDPLTNTLKIKDVRAQRDE